MTQNIYDNDEFFSGYSRLPRSIEGLDGAPEWPSLQALLPDLRGRRVLDLGCGFGWFCRWAREKGAVHIEGIDVSDKMLARARATTADASIIYARADLERLALQASSFDVVYSSLVLHYIIDLERLLAEVHKTLVQGGRLVFSVEHPLMTAPALPGWSTDDAGRKVWPVTGYLDEGPRSTDWLTKGVIKQHRTLATYVNLLLSLGFALTHVEEWGPSAQQILTRPQLADEHERPPFLLVAARR
ncbi:MAG: class I SAM-dependent methyltransferase [Hyphomicrobiaceae bacterium]|nr:class I SAM-dependent methyltransferase [Hyphomicrobiaceae bacterium]